MMKEHWLLECLIFVSLLIGLTQAQDRYPKVLQEDQNVKLDQMNFHYEIYYNVAFHYGDPEKGTRNIGVLIEEKDFSEENLKELFKALSKGYLMPHNMCIQVVTNGEQIYPSGWPKEGDEPEPPNYHNYPWALFFRNGENEFFRYYYGPPNGEIRTSIIKRG